MHTLIGAFTSALQFLDVGERGKGSLLESLLCWKLVDTINIALYRNRIQLTLYSGLELKRKIMK